LQYLVMLYFLAGSYSMGYFFLRSGWPKIRILEEPYRIGWSIGLGVLFMLLVIGTTLYGDSIQGGQTPIEWIFSIDLIAAIGIATMMLFVRRKYIASKNIQVAVPKDYMTARIAAEKLTEKILTEDQPGGPIKPETQGDDDNRLDEVKRTLDKLTKEIGSEEEKEKEEDE